MQTGRTSHARTSYETEVILERGSIGLSLRPRRASYDRARRFAFSLGKIAFLVEEMIKWKTIWLQLLN